MKPMALTRSVRILLQTTLLAACTSAVVNGQGGAAEQVRWGQTAPPPPQNLQVLPKNVARAELNATMREFTFGLGVQCNYCHVREGQGGRNDMAADDKQPKKTARVMMQMMNHA